MMMALQIAALVMAYRSPEGVRALARYFAACGIDMVLHVDHKVDLEPFLLAIGEFDNVYLVEDRITIYWAGFTMVRAYVNLIYAANRVKKFDRFFFISEDSLPLRTPERFLASCIPNDNYIAAHPATDDSQLRYDRFVMLDSKSTQLRWLPTIDREVTEADVAAFVRLGRLREQGKKPIGRIWTGSSWFGLTADAAGLIIESWETDAWLRESFEFSDSPDETYFHTILALAGRLGTGRPLMHVEWTGDPPPRRFRSIEDIEAIDDPPALFVRKVELEPEDLERYLVGLL